MKRKARLASLAAGRRGHRVESRGLERPGIGRSAATEIELLLACVQPRVDVDDDRISGLLRGVVDWEKLVRLALAHGVSPLLARRLVRLRSGDVPDQIREALELHALDNRERNAQLVQELFRVLDELKRRGVIALPFKGQVLGAVAYGDFSLRRGGDIDLLVKKQDLAIVWQVLEFVGYRERTQCLIGRPMSAVEHAGYLRYQCEYSFFRASDQIVVEPHWAIVPKTMSVDLDCGRFWERAETVHLEGRDVPTLAAHDLLDVLCVHASKHEWTRLLWICDVAALVESHPGLDFAASLANARARGYERMLLLGLGLARRTLGTSLPSNVQARLDADAALSELVETFAQRLFTEAAETSALYELSRLRLRMRERHRDRVAYVLRTLVTPTEKHLRLVALPDRLHGLYVPVKIVHDYVALPIWQLTRRLRPGSMQGQRSR